MHFSTVHLTLESEKGKGFGWLYNSAKLDDLQHEAAQAFTMQVQNHFDEIHATPPEHLKDCGVVGGEEDKNILQNCHCLARGR